MTGELFLVARCQLGEVVEKIQAGGTLQTPPLSALLFGGTTVPLSAGCFTFQTLCWEGSPFFSFWTLTIASVLCCLNPK